jgi:hypothetical protein
MAIVADDSGALAAAVKVSTELPPGTIETGLNTAVTPSGREPALRVTLLLNPPTGATAMLAVPVDPAFRASAGGSTLRLNPGAALTVSGTARDSFSVPLDPVTATLAEYADAVDSAVNVKVDGVLGEAVAGSNTAVTPAGMPVGARVTGPQKPFAPVTEILQLIFEPATTASDAGAATSVNEGAAWKARLMEAVPWSAPLVPVIVMDAVVGAAEVVAVKVSAAVAPGSTACGENEAETPEGSPVAESETLAWNPLAPVIATVAAMDDPAVNTTEAGEAVTVKDGTDAVAARRDCPANGAAAITEAQSQKNAWTSAVGFSRKTEGMRAPGVLSAPQRSWIVGCLP